MCLYAGPLCENSVIWWRALCSSVSHFIHLPFLISSSTSVSYLLLHLLFQFLIPIPLITSSIPSYSFWTAPFHLIYLSPSFIFNQLVFFIFSLFFILLFLLMLFFPQRVLQFSSHTIPFAFNVLLIQQRIQKLDGGRPINMNFFLTLFSSVCNFSRVVFLSNVWKIDHNRTKSFK